MRSFLTACCMALVAVAVGCQSTPAPGTQFPDAYEVKNRDGKLLARPVAVAPALAHYYLGDQTRAMHIQRAAVPAPAPVPAAAEPTPEAAPTPAPEKPADADKPKEDEKGDGDDGEKKPRKRAVDLTGGDETDVGEGAGSSKDDDKKDDKKSDDDSSSKEDDKKDDEPAKEDEKEDE